ncbi:hypothetical protein D0U04_25350 [Bacillus clarus]|nr:hypothetical protein D0U04_25350 [Bacillus clarus]
MKFYEKEWYTMQKKFLKTVKSTLKKDIKSIETWSIFLIFFFVTLFSLKKFDNAGLLMYIKVFTISLATFIICYLIKCYRIFKRNKQNPINK